MNLQRTSIVGLLASVVIASSPAVGQDFAERMAQYQRPAAPTRRATAPAASRTGAVRPANVEMMTEEAPAAAPASPAPSGGQRILSGVYSAPMHSPNYNASMAPGCATCGHNPGFVPPADVYGTCAFGDGSSGACSGLFGVEGNCKNGCGWFGGCGGCGNSCCDAGCPTGSLVWAKFDVLLWWRQGHDLPPLVTTDPPTENAQTAGILPDAQILFGGGRVGSTVQVGGRLDVGTWLDPSQCIGFGDRFFGLGKDSTEFHATSNNVPVLAIPFQDFTNNNVNDALLIAYPGLRNGEIHISATSSVLGNDLYGKFLLCRDMDHRLDFITGWNYSRVADQIQMNTRSIVTEIGGVIPNGTVRTTFDQYQARNDFNGGILGLQWQRLCNYWTLQLLARISLGNMHETMTINGSTSTTVPNQPTVNTAGGALTGPSNIGTFTRNEFTAISEAGVNLGYRFAPCTQLTLGYNFIYFHDIVSPGSAIDTSQGVSGGVTRPQFNFTHSDFWAQGLSFGLVQEF